MEAKNESHAFSTCFDVLHSLTSLIFVFLSFSSGVANKRGAIIKYLQYSVVLADTLVQMCNGHDSGP